MKLTQGDRQRTSEQVVTPSAHMQVMQGVESANQLLPSERSSPPYTQPGIQRVTATVPYGFFVRFHPVFCKQS